MLQHNALPQTRVLILDDDERFVRSLSTLLQTEGYAVRSTATADDALTIIAEGSVDLLLAELTLDDRDWAGFLSTVRRVGPRVVTVVVTGHGSIDGAVRAIKLGAFDYVTKPVVDEEIRLIVEKAARQQSVLAENDHLRQKLGGARGGGLESVIGRDKRMLKVFDLADAVADSKATLLMTGESGTGKSMLARAIHKKSGRRDGPFVEVSCAALPESLLESELFGHVKGAFTGASTDKPGRFFSADGGTIFLDEINSATPALQARLLRVLQERTFEPVGSHRSKSVDVRVILATNVDLVKLVAAGEFRQDLYYRINVVTIALPPLRDRATDIAMLASTFLRRFKAETGRAVAGFTEAAVQAMQDHDWPGNVRELENAIERAVLLSTGPLIDVDDLPEPLRPATEPVSKSMNWLQCPMPLSTALEHPERSIIESALKRNGWNRQSTAAELDIDRTTLYKKMRKYELDDRPR